MLCESTITGEGSPAKAGLGLTDGESPDLDRKVLFHSLGWKYFTLTAPPVYALSQK
jgi:hypothetical protein